MNIKVTDLEENIDKEYYDDDIREISKKGIMLPECFIDFEECSTPFWYSMEQGINGRKYVGARNILTDPAYMKFRVYGKDIFILFSTKDSFYNYVDIIRELGYETFDLS